MILDIARIKELTGGDPTNARGVYAKDEKVFVNQGKIILQTNNLPSINDTTDSVPDRLRLVECNSRVEQKDQDKHLAEKMIAESSGILNRFLEVLSTYARQGLIETESMKKGADRVIWNLKTTWDVLWKRSATLCPRKLFRRPQKPSTKSTQNGAAKTERALRRK